MMLHNVLFCIQWHTYVSILFKYTKMSKLDLINVSNYTTYRCVYILQWYINVENWIKDQLNALCDISCLSSVFSISYTHNSQCLPSNKTTHLMFFRDSHKSWVLSIAIWCRIRSAHDSSEGVRVIDATLRGCRLLSWPYRWVCACPRWPLPLPYPPQQKIGWIPLGTGWGHHLIRFWTARRNSGEQIQQTRANPVGEKFPRNLTWHALWLCSMWLPPNPVVSHPKHRVCDAWAAAPYLRSACRGTKPYSRHHRHPAQTWHFGTQKSCSWAQGCGWWVFSTPSAPAHIKNHQIFCCRAPAGTDTILAWGESYILLYHPVGNGMIIKQISAQFCARQHKCMTCSSWMCHQSHHLHLERSKQNYYIISLWVIT